LPRDQLPHYLRTLRSCNARDIYYQVRRYTEHIASGESFTLTDVQEGLQQCDNEAQRDKRSQATSTGRHRQSTQHDPHHSSSAANASSESPVVHSRTVECWSCGENHPLSACPTTSVADRKRFTIPVATRAVILKAAVAQAILVVAEVVVEVRSKEVLPVAVLLQHPVPAQSLPVAVVLHLVQAPTPPWPSRVLKTSSESPTSTL